MTPSRITPVGSRLSGPLIRIIYSQAYKDFAVNLRRCIKGGFVLEQLGRIPSVGDVVHRDGMRIEVLSTVGRRLKTLKVTRTT